MVRVKMIRMKLDSGKVDELSDQVADEGPLHIFLSHIHYATMLCTPKLQRELAVGNLLSEGVINSLEEVEEVELEGEDRVRVHLKPGVDAQKRITSAQPFTRVILTACGSADYWPFIKLIDRVKVPKVTSSVRVKAEAILKSMRMLNMLAEGFKETGGIHAASLNTVEGEVASFAEDVGRHNAIDKAIGLASFKNLDLKKHFITSTGRLSGDVVLKAARVGVPIVASITAPLSSGIEIAEKTGLTLIGFVRGYRFNLYTHPDRIYLSSH